MSRTNRTAWLGVLVVVWALGVTGARAADSSAEKVEAAEKPLVQMAILLDTSVSPISKPPRIRPWPSSM